MLECAGVVGSHGFLNFCRRKSNTVIFFYDLTPRDPDCYDSIFYASGTWDSWQ